MPCGEARAQCRADEGVRAGARPGGRFPPSWVFSFGMPSLGGTGSLAEPGGHRVVSEQQAQERISGSGIWQRENLPPPLIGGISNVPAAWVPVTGLALALGLGRRGRLGMLRVCRYPQALEEAPRFSSPPTIPRDMFSFQAGQGWADLVFFFFPFSSYFF